MPVTKNTQPPGDGSGAELQLPPGVKFLRALQGHKNTVKSVAFDRTGQTLASGSNDGTVKLWKPASGKLLRTLEGYMDWVWSVAIDPTGQMLASGSVDNTVNLWDSVKLLGTLKGHKGSVLSVAFDPTGQILASGSSDSTVNLWTPASGKLLRTLEGHKGWVWSVAFDPIGQTLASASTDGTVKLWEPFSGKLLHTLEGHKGLVLSVAFDPTGQTLASGSSDNTVKLWAASNGKLLRTLEGHTGSVDGVAFSVDGQLLASKSRDGTVRLWRCDTWETVAVIPAPTFKNIWVPALAFHPTLPLLATSGSAPGSPKDKVRCEQIHLWELDLDVLLGKRGGASPRTQAAHHTTGKIVLVGDHSVGKSALGYRMIHGQFKEQASTHGQQFWVFPALGKRRADNTECEAILWDFAGQPDYRLVHALFVDDADLALVLFDASDIHDPLHGVGFWLKQLQVAGRGANDGMQGAPPKGGTTNCPIVLVAAQTDRGSCTLTPEELKAFCERHGIAGPIHTSANTGTGVAELIERMKAMIPWEDKPATVTTATFKRIKDYVLGLKGAQTDRQSIVTPEELRRCLEASDADWRFTDAEMLTAVGHLENYGYVKRLRTSKGEQRILLEPERLNNLASSFVLEARRNPKGLGSLEEKRLLAGGYAFPEVADLDEAERAVLLDAAALLFLEHNVCFRETDPLRMEPYLVFPELINLKKPLEEEKATEDGVAYTVTGPTENVFASLVVLLGYTHTFTRTNQWQNNARYEVGEGLVCGFRQEGERDGELDFVLCFCPKVGGPVRTLFQGLFESFLARRNLTVMRYEPVRCSNPACCHLLDRSVVRQRMKDRKTFACCNDCGAKLSLPTMAEPIQLTREVAAEVETQRRAAEQRTRFEQAVYRVQAYVAEQKIKPPECFISYAWGVPEHERWVEKRLATDLQKAGIAVVLDRWHNAQIGASVARFVDRIEKSDRIIVVGTPLYRRKYENKDTNTGYVVAAEVDLISNRLLGTEAQKASVLPLLLAGEKTASLPPLLHGRVRADFREEAAYFTTAFDLILSLYQLPPTHPAVADLLESLRGPEMR
ncbi:MAG: TIR domain-containing protein [Candidatus Sumerlaeota bacterium]|nr:TIR domain-containing protein [Candidatus Sumerlaeota bacterium]